MVESLEGRESPVIVTGANLPILLQSLHHTPPPQVRRLGRPPAAAAPAPRPAVTISAFDTAPAGIAFRAGFLPGMSTPAGIPLPFANHDFQPITQGQFDGVPQLGTAHTLFRLPPWTGHVG
jgi:hypothetical protein